MLPRITFNSLLITHYSSLITSSITHHFLHHSSLSPCPALLTPDCFSCTIPAMFAEVAVPVHIRQTFTYRLPGDMAERAGAGCRVVVPFGKKLLTGFIVALHAAPAGELIAGDIKDVEELVDESPIVAPDILDLTRWMSDYYHAPWGECLRTALPAGATVATEQILTITEAGRAALAQVSAGFSWSSSKLQAL